MEELSRIRAAFVRSVTPPVLQNLLDDLLEDRVLNGGEKESVLEQHGGRADRARRLVDLVKRKGERASQRMLVHLEARDQRLHSDLDVLSAPKDEQGWSPVLIPSSEQFKTEKLKKSKDIYPVLDPRVRIRLALLITNIDFDHISRRDGAEKDELNMETLFTSLGYKIVKHRNLSGQEMDNAVKAFSRQPGLQHTDSVFVVVMSHGRLGAILGVRWKETEPDEFPVDNIYKHLDTAACPALCDKPKVIIIQACRGEEDGSVIFSDGDATLAQADRREPRRFLAGGGEDNMEDDAFRRAHKEKDFISLLSCTADTVSYRHSRYGSFLIQYIVEVFNTCAHEDHIEELFRKVMKHFEDDFPSPTRRQMPVKDRCTLTKLFYPFPGH